MTLDIFSGLFIKFLNFTNCWNLCRLGNVPYTDGTSIICNPLIQVNSVLENTQVQFTVSAENEAGMSPPSEASDVITIRNPIG